MKGWERRVGLEGRRWGRKGEGSGEKRGGPEFEGIQVDS